MLAIAAYHPCSLTDAARMLGCAAGNTSRECRALGIDVSSGITLPGLYRLWCFKTLMVITKTRKRNLLLVCQEPIRKLVKTMESYGEDGSKEAFYECYRHYIETGKCNREGGYKRAHPECLKRALEQRRLSSGHYINREILARYLNISPASATVYLKALGVKPKQKINKSLFVRVVRLAKIRELWYEMYHRYPKNSRGYYRDEGCIFTNGFTISGLLALESRATAIVAGLLSEYNFVQKNITVDASDFDTLASTRKTYSGR